MLNKIKARVNNKKGFTLVELIVVIVIILILAAVLVPNVTKYVGNAKQASLKSDASAILTQLQADATAYVSGLDTDTFKVAKDATYVVSGKTAKCVESITDNSALGTPEVHAEYIFDGNAITLFLYRDGSHYIKWDNGVWKNVDQS